MAVSEDTCAVSTPGEVAGLDEIEIFQAHATLTRILGAIEEYVYVGEFLPDDSYRVLFTGPCRERFLGMAAEQARTAVWANYVHPADMDLFDTAHDGAQRTGRLDAEYRLVGADGCVRWVRDRGRLRVENGRRLLDGSVLDVTAIKATQAALESARAAAHHASQIDPLTGVWNRRSLDARITGLGDGPVGVLMLDLDHFKNINDLFGHAAGDAVLISVADRLRATTRETDSIFRMGGEEFLLVLPGLGDDTALRAVAEAARTRINSQPVRVGGESIELTASIGAARCDNAPAEIDTLLRAADRGLYAAKRAGRNRVRLAADNIETGDEPESDSAALRLASAVASVGAAPRGALEAHLNEVSQLAMQVARRLSCPAQQVTRCRLAGILHEVGKMHTLAATRSGSMPSDESEPTRAHPAAGAALVASIPDLRPLAPIVGQSHERYDGTGHPGGIAGDQIPLEARIISAANAWSAMTNNRPQRPALTHKAALAELDRVAGTQLDPRVVDALRSVLADPGATDPD